MRAQLTDRQAEVANAALDRAHTLVPNSNDAAVVMGFSARGIAVDDIIPRVNVLSFQAWLAMGRVVKKGEHGVKLTTWIPIRPKKGATPAMTDSKPPKTRCRPKSVSVFHISQTEPMRGTE